jgi:poly(3-hydroxybutyrate) depolymerase
MRVCVAMLAVAGALSFVKLPSARAEEIRIDTGDDTGDDTGHDTGDGARTAIALAAPGRPGPAILVLHGGLGTAEGMLARSGFAEAAAKHGLAAV